MDDIYRDELLEHFKNPKNYGRMEKADIRVEQKNMSCGDSVEVFVSTKNGSWEDIQFVGQGCAVSVAITSMLIEYIKGKGLSIADVVELSEENLLEVAGMESISPSRKKCALLGLRAVKAALGREL